MGLEAALTLALALALGAPEPPPRGNVIIGNITVRKRKPPKAGPASKRRRRPKAPSARQPAEPQQKPPAQPPPAVPESPALPPAPAAPPAEPPSSEPPDAETSEEEDSGEESAEIAEGEAEAGSKTAFELSGFALGRLLLVSNADSAPLGTLLPGVGPRRAYFELNLQPRVRLPNNVFGVFADATLFLATSAPQHLALLNEGYLESTLGPVYLLAGRRRVIWGSGLAFNPTDLLNPQKNPLDVDQQRTGAFLLPMGEVQVRSFTFTAVASPAIRTNDWALPTRFDFRSTILGLRAYASWLDADWNLIYFQDFGRKRSHLGASFSRFFGDLLELHLEVRARTGSPDRPPLPELPFCPATPQSNTRFTATGLVGGRLQWPDQTLVSFEYLYWGDGLSAAAYRSARDQLPCIGAAVGGPLPTPNSVGHPLDLPILFLRRHYAFLVFQRPRLVSSGFFEDLGVGLNVTMGLEDASSILQLILSYSFGGRAALRLSGVWWAPGKHGQFALLPARAALFSDVRVFF